MNCERYRNELEDFLYGELGEARAAEMRAHLIACPDCAALRDRIERENEVFTRFYEQTAIEPTGEMWEAVRARINTEPGRLIEERRSGWSEVVFGWLSRPAALRQAAFAILLIALSVAATTYFLKRGGNKSDDLANRGGEVQATPAPVPAPTKDIAGTTQNTTQKTNDQPARGKDAQPVIHRAGQQARQLTEQELVNQQIARAEREYQKAVRMLDSAIDKRREGLDPALVKQYEASLALIDNSIAASRRALRQRPDDPTAGQFLLAAYAKKVELMQDIAMR